MESETQLSDRLLPTLAKYGRMKVGRAIIRRHKERYFILDFGRICRKRLRLHRRTATEAIRTAVQRSQELKQHGQLAAALTTAQRFEASVCFSRLAAVGATMTEAVDALLKNHPLGGKSRTLLDVITEVIARKRTGNRRARYVADLDWKLRSFERSFPARHIASISLEDMEAFIADHHAWSPVTQRSYVQAYNVLFNFAVKRGYRTENPCQRLELPEIDKREPVIFSIDQARRVMALTESSAELGACRAYAAIGMFAGIRPEEIEQQEWEQVDFENRTITVLGANAKCRARRVVDISPNLFAWLNPLAKPSGRVLESSVKVLRMRLRAAMGLAKWPHDVMRHSFGSYHFAKHRNEALTRNQMGHSDDGRMFFNHYRALVQPAAAAAFWEIYPSAIDTPPTSTEGHNAPNNFGPN